MMPRLVALLGLLACRVLAQEPRILTVCEDATRPPGLDPHKQFSDKIHTVVQQIFEGLVEFTPEGKIAPALAESWRLIDPYTTEFRLRPNVTFHNGEAFTARSVRSTIERYLDPATGFPGRPFLDPIAEAEVVDPLTVRIRTRIPDGLLLFRLAAFVVMAPGPASSEAGFGENPVGTGPFRLKKLEPDRILMGRNPDYWKPGLPRVDGLEFVFFPRERALQALLENRLDIISELRGTLTLQVTRNASTRIVKNASYVTFIATLDNRSGPLSDGRVRRALNLAIDRDRLIKFFANGNGRGLATASMPGEFGHDDQLEVKPHDPDRARQLLVQAGYPEGFELEFLVKNTARDVMAIIARHWESIGVKVAITETNVATEFEDLRSRDWDGYMAATAEPMCHMAFLPGIGVYSKGPFSLVRHPPFDALYEAVITTRDLKMQEALCHELDAMIYEEDLLIVTFQQIRTYAVNRRVDFTPSVTGMSFYKSTGLKP